MKGKNIIFCALWLVVCGICQAQTMSPNAEQAVEEEYEVTSMRDTLITNDTIIVIHTVCAPICSSRARVFNKEWQEIGVLRPPFQSIFPEAYIENGKLLWRDNDNFDYTPQE